ncbi:sigma factor-like helix-turn-helix DNA-binding protein [Lactobacillus johnsonii]|uniref:sigma factor-like helix-turn-helix DNA-binding protein n=1 Tax=Lactobacillus johnsonii TaxID=33959 RepID=UPI00248E5834|nr:sigma factor-like helix-turn-helix DNA-binding protein [Lactobacillus johnsonii]
MAKFKDEVANNTRKFFKNKVPELLMYAGCSENVLLSGHDLSVTKVSGSKKNSAESLIFRVDMSLQYVQAIKLALNTMPPLYKQVIELTYFKHLKIFQIAQQIGYAERTIANSKNKMLKEFAIRFFAMQARLGIEDKDIIDLTKTKEIA